MDLHFSDEVAAAVKAGSPVVALESTVISHGLPFPQNLETADRLEQAVRDGGAVPATIAVFDGGFYVGLSREQIEHLATVENVRKISRRDLAIAVAKKLTCATTVATTAFIAHRAGIPVFATGGIGGVHRGDRTDVSRGCRIERGAVLEEKLAAAAALEPSQRIQTFAHRQIHGRGARLERNHHGVGIDRRTQCVRWHTDSLNGVHAASHQYVGQVGGPSEIVGNTTEQGAMQFHGIRERGVGRQDHL